MGVETNDNLLDTSWILNHRGGMGSHTRFIMIMIMMIITQSTIYNGLWLK